VEYLNPLVEFVALGLEVSLSNPCILLLCLHLSHLDFGCRLYMSLVLGQDLVLALAVE
jgi:hypothetical protein